jgi:glucose/arabinose dehydrogenase
VIVHARQHDIFQGQLVHCSQVFAQGWLNTDETGWGRPADVLPLPDGPLLISDDSAGVIYRVTHQKP